MTWEETCGKAIRAFNGETPGATIEAACAAHYELDPERVHGAITRTAALLQAGRIRSGWAVLNAELAKHQPARQQAARHTATVSKVEAWMAHTGCQFPNASEAVAEARALWKTLTADDEREITNLWERYRPAGERVELEHATRLAAIREHNRCDRCGQVRPFTAYRCMCPKPSPTQEAAA